MPKDNSDSIEGENFPDAFEYGDLIADAPDLGFFQLTIKDAAALMATDLWFAGKINETLPEADFYEPDDPVLQQALSKHFSTYEKRLQEAIEIGSLETTKIRRNFHEGIEVNQTLIKLEDLEKWLQERGYPVEDSFYEYIKEEQKIFDEVITDIFTIRMSRKYSEYATTIFSDVEENPENYNYNELKIAFNQIQIKYLGLISDQINLKKQLAEKQETTPEKTERPLSTRSRRTLLTIIAALCSGAGINYQDRGAAQRIGELTEEIGAPVTDDTIRLIIREIDDAVETRMR